MRTFIKRGRIIVSVLLLLLMVAGLAFMLVPAKAAPMDTYHSGWKLVRETATEDGTNFAAVYNLSSAEGDFASKDSSTVVNGGPYRIRSYAGRGGGNEFQTVGGTWKFVICGGLADNDTFSFTIAGWSKINGMLQIIAEGTGIIGTQDVVLYLDDSATASNIWRADTINLLSATKWPLMAVYNSGANQVCIILVDTTGLEWVQFVIYDADGTGTEANNLTVYGRPY